jgi:hypothetical protein
MADPAIECGHPHISDLLTFVAARVKEERSGVHGARPAWQGRTEILDVVENVLLNMALNTCRPGQPCALPDPCLRSLGEYAFIHQSHPDYHPAWSGWRLQP